MKTLDGVADWPISYRELEPYYDENDREMGVAGLAGDPAAAALVQTPPRRCRSKRARRNYRPRFR